MAMHDPVSASSGGLNFGKFLIPTVAAVAAHMLTKRKKKKLANAAVAGIATFFFLKPKQPGLPATPAQEDEF